MRWGSQRTAREASAGVSSFSSSPCEFAARVKSVGDTLGFGNCEKWTVDTERYQVIGLSHDANFIALLRRKDAALVEPSRKKVARCRPADMATSISENNGVELARSTAARTCAERMCFIMVAALACKSLDESLK